MLKLFRRDRRANVAVMFSLAAVPIVFALGASADYGLAVRARAKLDAMADAAALAAVTPQVMQQPTDLSTYVATQFFKTQAATVANTTLPSSQPQVAITETTTNGQRTRTVKVTYSANYATTFSAVLSRPAIAIGGTASATASTSPNIDFYLMLDTSPSMAIPATQDGINWMVANTPNQGGCAFACHEKNPAADGLGNPNGEDNYALAKDASTHTPLILRMDLVTQAVVSLIGTAQSSANQTGTSYRLAAYTFDASVALPMPLQAPSSTAQSQAQNIQMLEVDSNNKLNGQSNSDEDTNFDAAFTQINSDMNAAGPGTGTNTTGDKPQQVLMIVTDGVADENWNSGRSYLPLGGTTSLSAASTDWCSKIKANPDVRIAVLYLTYNPLPSNSWYKTYIAPEQSEIAPTLQNCASPGLFFQVNTGGDVTAAMNAMFQAAVRSAHLTN